MDVVKIFYKSFINALKYKYFLFYIFMIFWLIPCAIEFHAQNDFWTENLYPLSSVWVHMYILVEPQLKPHGRLLHVLDGISWEPIYFMSPGTNIIMSNFVYFQKCACVSLSMSLRYRYIQTSRVFGGLFSEFEFWVQGVGMGTRTGTFPGPGFPAATMFIN